ncbi:hypothetical protein HDU67_005539 [Dinochytrium kinnereticum]|nr:hypothetical protein HDU67_005539 [Dinochytrium kinnereticum]
MPSSAGIFCLWIALLGAPAALATSPRHLQSRASAEAAIAACAPAASAMVGCTGVAARNYRNLAEAASGAVEAAGCICGNVFGPDASIISLSQACVTALVTIPSPELGAATDTVLSVVRMVTGAVPGWNLNINQAITGISRVPQACSDFSSAARALPALLPNSASANTTRVIAVSRQAVEVVNNTQMVFQVNGKQVVPVHPDVGKTSDVKGFWGAVREGAVVAAVCAAFVALV